MKFKHLLTALFLLLTVAIFAQNAPSGINYQAVARDGKGQVLTNKTIGLQINLYAGEVGGKAAYSEIHRIQTNDLGLFSLVIGKGEVIGGDFQQVPWSTMNVWMELAMDENGGKDFQTINASQLMAVPYAFHAATAADLTNGQNSDGTEKTAAFWKVNGNELTFPGPHFVGTLDAKDFVFKTTNLERMRITAAGDINISNTLNVGVDINVGRDANIGRNLDVDNNANIDNDLTVGGIARFNNTTQSTTKDNGAVIVEGGVGIEKNLNVGGNTEIDGTLGVDGITTLKNTTQSNTKDDGALIVEGGAGIEKNVNIGGNTEIDGTLGVDGVTTLKNTTQSTTKDDGALVVEGGAGIEKNLNVGGNTSLGGALDVGGVLTVTNTTESTNKDNGALVVEGGAGIEKNINVGGNSGVTGNSAVGGTLGVNGIATFNNTAESTNKDNGAVVVEGGAGIEKNLNVGGNSGVTGNSAVGGNSAVTGNSTVGGTLGVNGIATFNNTTQSTTKDNGAVVVEGGVGIEKNLNVGGNVGVTGNTTTGSLNVNTTAVISGSTTVNGATNLNGQVTINANLPLDGANYNNYPLRVQGSGQGIGIKVNSGSPNSVNNFITFFDSANNAVGTVEGMDANDLLNWPPYIYQTASLTAEVVAAGVNIGLSLLPNACAGLGVVACPPEPSVVAITIADEILAIANLAAYQTFSIYYLGISYTTGSADYAEYLERRNVEETMMPGDIVGVVGGRISKHTGNASQHLVISTNPAVLGNKQQPGNEERFEKVAFMGQVPVKVRGQVNVGDYILPSGLNDGTGFGVAPDKITANQYSQIVGVAWSAAPAGSKLSLVNLAIGLNTNDVARVVEEQQSKIDEQAAKIQQLERSFANMEERMAALESGKPYTPAAPAIENAPVLAQSNLKYIEASVPVSFDAAQVEEAILLLEDVYRSRGIDVDNHAGLKKLFQDQAYRQEIIQKVQDNYLSTRNSIMKMEAARK